MKPGKLKKEIELPLLVLVLLFFVTPVLIYLPAMESVVLPKSVFIAVMTAFLVAIVLLQPGRWMPRSMEAFRTALDVQVLAVMGGAGLPSGVFFPDSAGVGRSLPKSAFCRGESGGPVCGGAGLRL